SCWGSLAGRTVLLAHSDQDHVTEPEQSYAYALRARQVSDQVCRFDLAGDASGRPCPASTHDQCPESEVHRRLRTPTVTRPRLAVHPTAAPARADMTRPPATRAASSAPISSTQSPRSQTAAAAPAARTSTAPSSTSGCW
ncbi:MAG: alpha/beta hydrolase, partial [Pseudonocardia sp.]|nr:alpha/beta hydrolase [Pseudonocardia sp.]